MVLAAVAGMQHLMSQRLAAYLPPCRQQHVGYFNLKRARPPIGKTGTEPALAPVKVGVLPLSKKLNQGAEKVYTELSKYFNCEFDDRGNIGKRYRRQDEIGTPFCITYDFDSEEDQSVTVRDRDTMEQVRIPISGLKDYFADKFMF